jgi:hypothetical protein
MNVGRIMLRIIGIILVIFGVTYLIPTILNKFLIGIVGSVGLIVIGITMSLIGWSRWNETYMKNG